MRIRPYFAGAFAALLLSAAYIGLFSQKISDPIPNNGLIPFDKLLHFFTFFLLGSCFYWIFEINRRRNLQLSLLVCPVGLGIGSEVVQGLLNNGREFDSFDIVSNVVGSLAAILLSTWYHKRMLDRKRAARAYHMVPGDDEERDLELGEGVGGQETGVLREEQSLEQEVENWDENDWDEEDDAEAVGDGHTESHNSQNGLPEVSKT